MIASYYTVCPYRAAPVTGVLGKMNGAQGKSAGQKLRKVWYWPCQRFLYSCFVGSSGHEFDGVHF